MKIQVGALALKTTPLDWAGNKNRLVKGIEEARSCGVQLLVAPELAISGYGCEDYFLSRNTAHTALNQLLEVAKETHNMVLAVGIPFLWRGCLYNGVAIIQNGVIKGIQAKKNLAGDGLHYETRWFKPWPEGIQGVHESLNVPVGDLVFTLPMHTHRGGTEHIRIGFEICEDAWVADRPGIKAAAAGVDILINPSASHFAIGKTRTREQFVTEGSRAFSCAYVYANLLGNEAGFVVYDGDCLIANNGTLVRKSNRFSFADYTLTKAVVDLEEGRNARRACVSHQPVAGGDVVSLDKAISEERQAASEPESYESMTAIQEFLEAETLALRDYMQKSGQTGYVIPLSGGADSALCAILIHQMAVKMDVPADLLHCIYMPTENSSTHTLKTSDTLAKAIGCKFEVVNVQAYVDQLRKDAETVLGRQLNWDQDSATLQNMQARVRSLIPWTIANATQKLLITTSNRSEASVGYATMDGDTAGSYGPLGGVSKPFILKVLDSLLDDETYGPALRMLRSKPPSAELKPLVAGEMVQSDEADLMPYDILEAIEHAFITKRMGPEQILQEKIGTAAQIEKYFRLFAQNQWKRDRYARGPFIGPRNLDPRSHTRFPTLNGGFKWELRGFNRLTR